MRVATASVFARTVLVNFNVYVLDCCKALHQIAKFYYFQIKKKIKSFEKAGNFRKNANVGVYQRPPTSMGDKKTPHRKQHHMVSN